MYEDKNGKEDEGIRRVYQAEIRKGKYMKYFNTAEETILKFCHAWFELRGFAKDCRVSVR